MGSNIHGPGGIGKKAFYPRTRGYNGYKRAQSEMMIFNRYQAPSMSYNCHHSSSSSVGKFTLGAILGTVLGGFGTWAILKGFSSDESKTPEVRPPMKKPETKTPQDTTPPAQNTELTTPDGTTPQGTTPPATNTELTTPDGTTPPATTDEETTLPKDWKNPIQLTQPKPADPRLNHSGPSLEEAIQVSDTERGIDLSSLVKPKSLGEEKGKDYMTDYAKQEYNAEHNVSSSSIYEEDGKAVLKVTERQLDGSYRTVTRTFDSIEDAQKAKKNGFKTEDGELKISSANGFSSATGSMTVEGIKFTPSFSETRQNLIGGKDKAKTKSLHLAKSNLQKQLTKKFNDGELLHEYVVMSERQRSWFSDNDSYRLYVVRKDQLDQQNS